MRDKPNSNVGGGKFIWRWSSDGSDPLLPARVIDRDQARIQGVQSYSGVCSELESWQKKIPAEMFRFSEILLMITAWKLDRALKAWWSLAREHYTWNAKQPLLQQLSPVLSIKGRPQHKSPNSYPPCPPHLNAHLEDGSGSFLLLPACFFLMQPSRCLPIHFSPPFVKQWVKASYSQGTRQWKATAYVQNALQKLMLQFCFHYCAPPPSQLEWDHLSFSNCIRICINAELKVNICQISC